jgi:hypothetical protein
MADHQPSLSTPKLDWQEKLKLYFSKISRRKRRSTDAIRTLRAIQTKKLHFSKISRRKRRSLRQMRKRPYFSVCSHWSTAQTER